MRRVVPFAAVLMSSLALAVPATADASRIATAAATGETIVLPISMDWRIGYHSVSTCASWGLVTWPIQEGAVSWELFYKFNGDQRSKMLSPPFDDDEFDRFGWHPAKGTHWYGQSYSGRSSLGGKPVTCGDLQARQKALYSDVKLHITLAPDAKIVGRVRAPNGDPLARVLVRARGAGSDRTDARGRYEIDVPEKARRYVVQASMRGVSFRPRSPRVAVRPGRKSRVNFLARGHVIKGRVTAHCPDAGASRAPARPRCTVGVKGAKVTASKVGDNKTYRVRTKADGTYVMLVREQGGYVVKFSVDGKTWTKRTTVRQRQVTVSQDIGNRNTGGFIRR